ncbi:hypothetical protein ACA910_006572 [Epithemia clementina (nom. ined.)]
MFVASVGPTLYTDGSTNDFGPENWAYLAIRRKSKTKEEDGPVVDKLYGTVHGFAWNFLLNRARVMFLS